MPHANADMELFKIERFGIEYKEDWKKQQNDLFRLKIEKRKQRHAEIKQNLEADDHSVDNKEEDIDIKKKKKHKQRTGKSEVISRDDEELPKSEKNKRKAIKSDHELKETNNTGHLTNADVSVDMSKSKKKKKRKHSETISEIPDSNKNIEDSILSKKYESSEISNEEDLESSFEKSKFQEQENLNAELPSDIEKNNIESKKEEVLFPILEKQKHQKKFAVKRALPRWLNEYHQIPLQFEGNQLTIAECVDILSENTISNLNKNKITELFPVQSKIVPSILKMHKTFSPCFPQRSICVQSPTGSGKTLTYVLPIVEILSKNVLCELCCLVIVPSKELAMQVKQVFDQFVIGTRLKIGLFSGAKTIAAEQEKVLSKRKSGYRSLVDIIVCTSGRLMDHLKRTEGFSLKHLKFLVIDEADKMLTSENDSWVSLVLNSIHSGDCKKTFPMTAELFSRPSHYVQKFLFSATLTQNPEKIAPLELYNPLLFTTQISTDEDGEDDFKDEQRFVIPVNLVQKLTVVRDTQKPLVLMHVMCSMDYRRVLCFTNSLESTHRLYLLLKTMEKFTVAEFSSMLNEKQRKSILREFRENKISLLIATDAMSRGMDIDEVDLVINYDVPMNAKRYVHRAGRTARAGNKGETLTILLYNEHRRFTKMTSKCLTAGQSVENIHISRDDLAVYEEQYDEALEQLKKHVLEENKAKKI